MTQIHFHYISVNPSSSSIYFFFLRILYSRFLKSVLQIFNGKTFVYPFFSFHSWSHKSLSEGKWTWNSQCNETAVTEKVELWIYRHCKFIVEKCTTKLLPFGLSLPLFFSFLFNFYSFSVEFFIELLRGRVHFI